ncbi:ROK family protein [Allosaccharopolyspora coralli]|uniref:ROK family protein n=1 Tax=Allosaccharopolyspora coralli TaxID=2665642 RepID=A0A5Q3QBJ8_9PSEU|nr:ROK family transcriptional regulator [Allosaccharopolyspora coralli]QGK71842.1 ROK family protein [Allosaccharopolyspora coralli]
MRRDSWQGTNLPKVSGYNRAVVLDAIRGHDGISRVELADRTGLTAQTMSNIVRGLIGDGLVTEDGHAPSTGGKRRSRLRLVADSQHAVGLHLDHERLTGVLLDLSGSPLRRSERAIPPDSSSSTVIRALNRMFTQLVRSSGTDRLLGVGLAVPSALDSSRRGLAYGSWAGVPLADLVQDRLGVPVVMDGDGIAAAVGEHWSGGEHRTGSFLYVHLGSRVGIGLVLDDQVHRGTSGNAGEIAHVPGAGGRECVCGRRGCLDAYCSMSAVVADWRASANGTGPASAETVHAEYDQLRRAASDGDALAVKTLRQAASRLGQALAPVVGVLDLDRVVLGGPALRHVDEHIRPRVAKALDAYRSSPGGCRVESGLVGDDAGAVGAAALVLDQAHAPRLAPLPG